MMPARQPTVMYAAFLLSMLTLTSCLDPTQTPHIVVEADGKTYDITHEVSRPPKSFSCASPLSLQEWLHKAITTTQPREDNAAWRFSLFETEACYAVYFGPAKTRITDSVPASRYLPLSKDGYAGLDPKAVLQKIRTQLPAYLADSVIQHSAFWQQSPAIVIRFDDLEELRVK